ncbi:MAG: hypothetical protein ACRCX8_08935 [Sarcina sp.]
MKIKFDKQNEGFLKILTGQLDTFLIDTNIFIPPDRSRENSQIKAISFDFYRDNWIIPFIETFKPIGIHEAVYNEFQFTNIKTFINEHLEDKTLLFLCTDCELTKHEEIIESKIAKNTNYDPSIDNNRDKGEVKSLAYIATKGLPYFCSHDATAIRLIEDAETLDTCLENISAIQPFEVLYYFQKYNIVKTKILKMFFKYLYKLTIRESSYNPDWTEFISKMDALYKV